MDKIAVISDIHGNLEALKTVIYDIKEKGIQEVICLGDIIGKGSHSHECLEHIKKLCSVVLKGNYCYGMLLSDDELLKISEQERERILWCKNKLMKEDIEFIQKMPFCYEMYISGRLVRFFHATPDSLYKVIGDIDSIETHYGLFLPSQNTVSFSIADVSVYGHIHMQYMKKMYNRTIINTGAVGNSIDVFRNKEKDGSVKNTTVANYLILEGNLHSKNNEEPFSFSFVSLPYAIDKELETNDENVEKEEYEEEIKNGCYRDMEKVYKMFLACGIDKDKI